MKKKVECSDCSKDITNDVQVYDQGKVMCQDCNLKQDN